MRLILGSSSKYRQQILREMGYSFEVVAPAVDEKSIRAADPRELVTRLAEAKAEAVLAAIGSDPAVILTSDQVVTHGDEIREKPASEAEARRFLRTASDGPTETVTAICVANTVTGERRSGIDVVRIYLRSLSDELIDRLIQDGELFYCAGGLRLEDPLIEPFIDQIEGTMDSVMGLPKELTQRLLEEVAVWVD